MLNIGLFRNSKKQQHKRERKYAKKMIDELEKGKTPNFCYGIKELGLKSEGNEKETLKKFVNDWFNQPRQYLDYTNYKLSTKIEKIKNKQGYHYDFLSFIDQRDKARFFEDKQPFYGRGEKIAFIILPHWNAYFDKYRKGTSVIRNFFLPVATYRYFSLLKTEKQYAGKSRYDIIGPNLGLTIKRFWQDVLNIEFFGNYLKNKLGYEKVGIWSYSIGSPRGLVASMFSEKIFDFLIMNFLADSFSQALLHGISTQDIADELRLHLSEKELEYLWSPLDPGKYQKYFNKLPKYTYLNQPKYDLVFGEKNNKILVEKMKKQASFVKINYGNYGHLTHGEVEKLIPVIHDISRFVIKNSNLKFLC